MTDWVLKGSIRGPAGEIPSVDQFLKIAGGALSKGDNEKIASLLIMGEGTSLSLDTSEMYSNIAVNGPSGSNKKIRLQSSSSSSTFTMDDKSVGSITDTILSGSGNALATDKAVKDYVDTSIADIDIPEALPEGGTEGQVLTKTSEGEAWSDIPDAFPSGGTNGQVLTKTSDGEAWSDIPDALPSGGTNGQVLTKTAEGEAWQAVPQPDLSAYATTESVTSGLATKADAVHTHTVSQVTDFPSSMPASDVSAWAKEPTKPTYTASEVGAAAASHTHSAADVTSGTLPVARGGTGVTTEDAVAQLVFSHAPEASPTQAGVVKTLSDQDFCEYMGIDYNPDDWS